MDAVNTIIDSSSLSADAVISEVNRIATALAALPSTDDLPRFLTHYLKETTQALAVSFAEYRPIEKVLAPVCIETDSTLLKKALAVIGKKFREIHSPVSDETYREIVSVSVGIRYSLHEVTFGAVPKSASAVVGMITGIDRLFGLSYVIEGELFGTTVIALKKDQPDPAREYLEAIASLGAVSLRRMRADTERHQSEERFAAVFHRCPIGIEITRLSDAVIVDANDAVLSLFEYTRSEIIGGTTATHHVWVDTMDRVRLIEQISRGPVRNFETRMRTKSGRMLEISMNAVLITVSDEKFILCFIEDITERKHSEEERRNLERQLIKAQRMESIGTLAGGIAHDFNNLLAMLLGNAELLRTYLEHDPALVKYIDRIIEVSSRGASITKQLLLFSRQTDIELEPVSLTRLVDEVQTMLVHFIPKSITIVANRSDAENFINADAGLIHQVIVNLCLNAKDAMDGSGTLTLAERRVDASEIRARDGMEIAGPYVALSVSDTGCGIDEAQMSKIFDPFFTTKEKGKGTGLGLSIVHGIIKSHSGFIDVQSVRGEGTTFLIYFPAIDSPSSTPA